MPIHILLQVIPPDAQANGQNLIPWIISFCLLMVSGVVTYVLRDMKKSVDDLSVKIDGVVATQAVFVKSITELEKSNDEANQKLERLSQAVFIMTKEKLLQMAIDASSTPRVQHAAQTMVADIEAATKQEIAKS